MRIKVLFWVLVLLPFATIVFVNETREKPVETYDPDRCTRFCHSHGCLHFAEKYRGNQSPFIKECEAFYFSVIKWLGNSGTGLHYRDMNLILFATLAPFVMSLLLWGAIRKPAKKDGKNT